MKLLPILRRLASPLAVSLATTLLLPAQAQEVTLKAVNAFQEGTYYARNFEKFVQKVNAEGKGVVQINYLGGPKAIPTMEQGAALRNGVVDLSNTTTSFVAGVSPESLAVNYATVPWAEMRRNGTVDYLNKLMMEKGLYYYARTGDGVPMQVAPGEVFTALDRGVVDGYGWPLLGIFDMGWHEKTKFRVDPGFYNIELGIIFSAKSWNALSAAQRDFLNKQVAWVERMNVDMATKDGPADIKRQADAGIQTIKLPDAEAKRMLTLALESGWAGVLANSPQHGAELRKRMAP